MVTFFENVIYLYVRYEEKNALGWVGFVQTVVI